MLPRLIQCCNMLQQYPSVLLLLSWFCCSAVTSIQGAHNLADIEVTDQQLTTHKSYGFGIFVFAYTQPLSGILVHTIIL